MKKVLLFPIMICLLLAGCQDPDDDVDMPVPEEPQKPENDLIIGVWENKNNDNVYEFDETDYVLYWGGQAQDQGRGDYSLIKEGDETFIKIKGYLGDYTVGDYTTFEITSITDSSMTWETDIPSPEPPFDSRHVEVDFRKRKAVGHWRTTSTTKVTYDGNGMIIKDTVGNQTEGYDIDAINLTVYPAGEGESSYRADYYIDYAEAGRINLFIIDEAQNFYNYELASVTEDKMTWIQKESPTVSYIIEFDKESL